MSVIARTARRVQAGLDAAATRAFGWAWNPLHQTGPVAVAALLVLIATGLVLVFFYRVGAPSESVARIAAQPWFAGWIRTLHRYATDVFVIATVAHGFRMFAQSRDWGPRTLAWISGLLLFAAGLICTMTGYVLVWDSFGERLAREGGRLLDVLPVFSEPLSRIFAGDAPVPSAYFFVNLFIHIAVPLAIGAALWIHISRVMRPKLLPPKKLLWGMIGGLTALSIVFQAPLGTAANPFELAASTPMDLFVGWWLPLSEKSPASLVWGVVIAVSLLLLLVPRLSKRERVGSDAVSVVDPRLCTGCEQCSEDCPWGAITMVERTDGRDTLLAQVDASKCVSCGICAGSCAPMGIGPVGRNGRDQLADLRELLLPAINAAEEPAIVAVHCSRAPKSHLDALKARGAELWPVSCAGNLHTSVIELLIRSGSPGVLVYGCPPRDCVGREGTKWLYERVYNDREAELQPRVDRNRLRIATMAGGDLSGTLSTFDAFAADIQKLARPEGEANAVIDALCETAEVVEEGV